MRPAPACHLRQVLALHLCAPRGQSGTGTACARGWRAARTPARLCGAMRERSDCSGRAGARLRRTQRTRAQAGAGGPRRRTSQRVGAAGGACESGCMRAPASCGNCAPRARRARGRDQRARLAGQRADAPRSLKHSAMGSISRLGSRCGSSSSSSGGAAPLPWSDDMACPARRSAGVGSPALLGGRDACHRLSGARGSLCLAGWLAGNERRSLERLTSKLQRPTRLSASRRAASAAGGPSRASSLFVAASSRSLDALPSAWVCPGRALDVAGTAARSLGVCTRRRPTLVQLSALGEVSRGEVKALDGRACESWTRCCAAALPNIWKRIAALMLQCARAALMPSCPTAPRTRRLARLS